MTLHLPGVTLVAIDTAYHTLTTEAVNATVAQVSFGDVLLFSDVPLDVPGVETLPCGARSNAQAEEFVWHGIARHLKTDHILTVQWDGYVVRPDLWSDDFLAYDYIGALWPWHPVNRVGNGGFSLRSRRLVQTVSAQPEMFPFHVPEDNTLCRKYRPFLEARHGFRWADDATALRFSHERTEGEAFGFHGLWNFVTVLSEDAALAKLAHLVAAQIRNIGMVDLYRLAVQRERPRLAAEARRLLESTGLTVFSE